jgi:hypothetical protein
MHVCMHLVRTHMHFLSLSVVLCMLIRLVITFFYSARGNRTMAYFWNHR